MNWGIGSPEVYVQVCLAGPRTSKIQIPMPTYCVFCNIVAGTEPANIIYEDDEIIVIQNILRWVPVMLLAMTKKHTTQAELWTNHMDKVAPIAAEIGRQLCPGGFRLLSNFGYDAMQSQEHGHLHILGGTFLGHYVG
jgi:histidine triad (HIT) family protein